MNMKGIGARATRVALGSILAATALAAGTGCLVSGSNEETTTGNFVAPGTLDQIKPGKTTASWVRATLGPPSSTSKADGGSEVWKYNYAVRQESNTAVFLIFGGSSKTERNHTVFVELKDGLVTNTWRG
jgi:outer membrane protein assembly factor BamE (lipoprotein component of BamABCDE complex)